MDSNAHLESLIQTRADIFRHLTLIRCDPAFIAEHLAKLDEVIANMQKEPKEERYVTVVYKGLNPGTLEYNAVISHPNVVTVTPGNIIWETSFARLRKSAGLTSSDHPVHSRTTTWNVNEFLQWTNAIPLHYLDQIVTKLTELKAPMHVIQHFTNNGMTRWYPNEVRMCLEEILNPRLEVNVK